MTDTSAKPIRVSTDVTGKHSWIDLLVTEVPRVRAVFDANEIGYWVAHLQFSFDGAPPVTKIHLRHKTDPRRAQTVLDAAV